MSITPTSNLFTAISLADLAKPATRPAPQQRPQVDPRQASQDQARVGQGKGEQSPRRAAQDQQTFKQAAASDDPDNDGDHHTGHQVAADFRRESIGSQRPRFQKLGQLVDLSV